MRKTQHFVALPVILSLALTGCSDLFGSGDGAKPAALEEYSPLDGASSVSVLAPITAEFSRKLDPTSLPFGFRLLDGSREQLVSLQVEDDGKTVTMASSSPLDFGRSYTVEVTPELGFRNGSSFLPGANWDFTTEGHSPAGPFLARLTDNLGVLAHDSMEGRASGSSDELEAAEFLAERLGILDIPAAPGGYIQGFEAWANRLDRFINSQNVLAAVPGSGALSDEWIVVGAHYDHIGYRGLSDESAGPNNGADDNGSGTVTVLEMARLYREWVDLGGAGSQDRRSVLFAFWGAEEQGLLGSCHYVFDGPAVPISHTVATINFDMVGRLRNNTVYVSGVDASDDWVPLLRNANADELNLSIRPESCAGCTDHACFWGAGVPFLGFYTGTHDEYHRPGDDVDLINFDGMMTIGRFAFRILRGLVVMPEAPGLTKAYPSG